MSNQKKKNNYGKNKVVCSDIMFMYDKLENLTQKSVLLGSSIEPWVNTSQQKGCVYLYKLQATLNNNN